MYAGGANMWKDETTATFYIVGEGNKTYTKDACSECFNMYSSQDLQNWKFEGCVLQNEQIRQAAPPPWNNATAYPYYRMERPKVFQCPGTQKFVMWFHCDTANFAMTSVGVLTADTITGPYTWASHCFKPDGRDSYDMGVFYDDPAMPGGDGHYYLMRSVENNFAGISQMTADCLNVTGIISSGPHMEAQALMRDTTGVLHYVGSHETGWGANEAFFVTSPNTSLAGAIWTNDYNPSHSGDTYDSQSTFLYPFKHADGHVTHIWMADRWNMWGPGSIYNMTLIWLPLIPPSGPPPSVVNPGDIAQMALCNASDPTQQFQWNENGTVTHAGSGLCVTQPPNATTDTYLYLLPCGATNGSQTWYRTGDSISNTSDAFGPNCVNWNTPMQELGGQVILYRCGNSTQYNSRWDFPLDSNTPGLFQALSDASPTGYCLAGGPQWNPSQWTMPWQDAWSLKDYAAVPAVIAAQQQAVQAIEENIEIASGTGHAHGVRRL